MEADMDTEGVQNGIQIGDSGDDENRAPAEARAWLEGPEATILKILFKCGAIASQCGSVWALLEGLALKVGGGVRRLGCPTPLDSP